MLDWNNFFGQARQAQDSQLNRALALADLSLRQDTQKHQQRMDEIRNLHEQNYQTWLENRSKAEDTRAANEAKRLADEDRRNRTKQGLDVFHQLLSDKNSPVPMSAALKVLEQISPEIVGDIKGSLVSQGQAGDVAKQGEWQQQFGTGAAPPPEGAAQPPAMPPSGPVGPPMMGPPSPMQGLPMGPAAPTPLMPPPQGMSLGAAGGPMATIPPPTGMAGPMAPPAGPGSQMAGQMGIQPFATPGLPIPPQPTVRSPEDILSQPNPAYVAEQQRKAEELRNQTTRARAAELRAKLAEEESPSKIAQREAQTEATKSRRDIAEKAFKNRLGPWARSAALLEAQQKLSREALTMREGLATAQKTLLAARTVTERGKLSDKQKSETDKAKRFALSAYNTFSHQAESKKREADQIKFRLVAAQKDYAAKMAEFNKSVDAVQADPTNKAEEQRMWAYGSIAAKLKKSMDDLEDMYNQATEEHQVLEQDAGQTHDMLTKAGVLSQSDGKGSGFKKRNPAAAGKTSSDHLKSFSEAIGAGP